MSYVVHIVKDGILVVDGAALAGAADGGVILRAIRDGASNSAPIIGGAPDVQTFSDLMRDAFAGDLNAYARFFGGRIWHRRRLAGIACGALDSNFRRSIGLWRMADLRLNISIPIHLKK